MNLLWGWVVTAAIVMIIIFAIIKYADRIDGLNPDDDTDNDTTTDLLEATQVIRLEPLIMDLREVDDAPEVIQGSIVDELGEWKPWEHTMEQPLILADVLMSGSWEGLRANEIGMVAA